jgi:DNA-binding LacI/PurR family transcriptional regulator
LKRTSRRPRLADVARIASVSQATASVVLNNRVGAYTRVSPETQLRVLDAARAIGYVANPMARRLAGGMNHIMAIFTFEPVFPIDRHDFYYPFLVGIEEEAARRGYDLLLVTSSSEDAGKRRIYRDGTNQLQIAAGAILLGNEDKAEVEMLVDEDFPFVFIGRRASANDAISYVAVDYPAATTELTNYLFAHGHEKIAYLQSVERNESGADRWRGFERAHEQRGVVPDPRLNWAGNKEQLGRDTIRALLADGATAFVAENDSLAARLIQLGDALGLACPADFSLAVLGDPLSRSEPSHDWTSFNIPRREMGRAAVGLLLQILERGDERRDPLRVTLSCSFHPGRTTAAPALGLRRAVAGPGAERRHSRKTQKLANDRPE